MRRTSSVDAALAKLVLGSSLVAVLLTMGSDLAVADVAKKATVVRDENRAFSVTVPKGWRWESTAQGAYSQVVMASQGPLDISITVTSRPLTSAERQSTTAELLGHMMNVTVEHEKSRGSRIINVGRVKPFVQDRPAVAVVTASKDGRDIVTYWATVTHDRNYGFVTVTKNLQGSSRLEAIVRGILESLTVH